MTQQSILPTATPGANCGITPFQFESHAVRVIIRDGEPWFVGKDVAEVLGYSNPQKAIRDHCKAGRPAGVNDSFTLLDPQTVIIPERDLYRLIMRSNLPAAQRFEEWVVGEVLPSIRKTGAYVAPGASAGAAPLVGSAQGLVPLSEALALSVERGMTSKAAAGAVLRAASLSLFPGAQAIFDAMRPSRAAPKPAAAAPVQLELSPVPQPAPAPARKPRAKPAPLPTIRLSSRPFGGFDGLNFVLAEAGEYVVGGETALRSAMLARGFVTDAGGPTSKGRALVSHRTTLGHHWRLGDLFRALGAKA